MKTIYKNHVLISSELKQPIGLWSFLLDRLHSWMTCAKFVRFYITQSLLLVGRSEMMKTDHLYYYYYYYY